MEMDYCKDNFNELDKFLYNVAATHNKKLNGSVLNFIGCTKTEIRDVLVTTVSRMVPTEELDGYKKEIERLIA